MTTKKTARAKPTFDARRDTTNFWGMLNGRDCPFAMLADSCRRPTWRSRQMTAAKLFHDLTFTAITHELLRQPDHAVVGVENADRKQCRQTAASKAGCGNGERSSE